MRRWAAALALGVACAAPAAAHAQPAEIAYGALPGGLHVDDAAALPEGAAIVELLSGFGYRSGVLAPDHRFGRAVGDVAAAYGVTGALSVGLSLDGYYDRHYGYPSGGSSGCGATCDDGYVGNPHLYARYVYPIGRHAVGAQLGVWAPGNKAPSLRPSATSVDLLALASLAAGPGTLSLDAGFRLDRSAQSVDDLMRLSLQDRISLGVSEYDEVLGGARYAVPLGRTWVGVEASLEDFVGSPPAGMASFASRRLLVRGAMTAGVRIADRWELAAFVEAASEPAVSAAQVHDFNIPVFPYEPEITGGLSLAAGFGGEGTAAHVPPPCWATPAGCTPDVTPLYGVIAGTVVDRAGKPVAGARVTVQGHTYGAAASYVTDADGSYRIEHVQVGRRIATPGPRGPTSEDKLDEPSLVVSAELGDGKPATATLDAPRAGPNTVPPLALEPALPAGQLEGIVRTQAGRPIAGATIAVSPGAAHVESGADGTFKLDLAPGKYKVTVQAPGLATQELDVTIDPNGVAIKELVLHQ